MNSIEEAAWSLARSTLKHVDLESLVVEEVSIEGGTVRVVFSGRVEPVSGVITTDSVKVTIERDV